MLQIYRAYICFEMFETVELLKLVCYVPNAPMVFLLHNHHDMVGHFVAILSWGRVSQLLSWASNPWALPD